MPAHKGQPKVAGRAKGTPNKVTKALKEMILGALDEAGGEAYLVAQAHDNPGPFMALIGKVLPTTISGPNEGPIKLEHDTAEAKAQRARQILAETFAAVKDQ